MSERTEVTGQQVKAWVDDFMTAWEAREVDALVALFTPDALFQWMPRTSRLGTQEVRDELKTLLARQTDVKFSYTTSYDGGGTGTCRWTMTFTSTQTRGRIRLSGKFFLELAEDGRCDWFVRPSASILTGYP